jgi:FkbM family methyltransferase
MHAKQVAKLLLPPLLVEMLRHLRRPQTVPDHQLDRIAEHERRNAGRPPTEFVLRDDLEFRITPDSQEAFSAFALEPEMVHEMDAFIGTTRDRWQLLDVGALHGVFSLAFASRRGTRVVAVDPSPLAFPRLLYNAQANPQFTIRPVEIALSDSIGALPMHFEWQHAVAYGAEDERMISVPATTGDALCEELAFSPDAIKIDVEGHEVQVLAGLRKTISRNRPVIFLEVHPGRIRLNRRQPADLVAAFRELRYDVQSIAGDAVSDLDLAHDLRLVLTPR